MKTIDSAVDVSVRLTIENVTPSCPVDGHVDVYSVTIEYRPDGQLIELKSLAEWFADFDGTELTQEDLADHTARTIRRTANPESFTVTVTGEHYGVETVVTAP